MTNLTTKYDLLKCNFHPSGTGAAITTVATPITAVFCCRISIVSSLPPFLSTYGIISQACILIIPTTTSWVLAMVQVTTRMPCKSLFVLWMRRHCRQRVSRRQETIVNAWSFVFCNDRNRGIGVVGQDGAVRVSGDVSRFLRRSGGGHGHRRCRVSFKGR